MPEYAAPEYPAAERLDLVDDLHGRAVPDPYRWLEDAADPRTVEWRAAQDALMDDERAAWTTRDHFAERIAELMGAGSVSPPYIRGDWTFTTRREPGQQFPVLYARDGSGAERAIFDPIAIDPAGVTTMDSWQPSKEGDRVAVQYSIGGDEESILTIIDTATGERIEDGIDRCRYSPVAWLPGGQRYYYVRRLAPELLPETEQKFHRRVYLHTVGANPEDDILVFGAGMTMTNYYGVEVSRDGRWLQVSASEGTEPRNDLWIADLAASPPEAPAFQLVQGDVDAQTSLHVGRNGLFYISTDRDAPRGRLLVSAPEHLWDEPWRELLPEESDSVLDGYAILDGPEMMRPLLLVSRTRHVVSELSVHDLDTGALIRTSPLPGAGTVGGPVERPDGGPIAWIVYTDHTTVPAIYSFDGRTEELSLFAEPPGVVDVPRVHSRQVTYASADGSAELFAAVLTRADELRAEGADMTEAAAPRSGCSSCRPRTVLIIRARRSSTATAASASRCPPAPPRRSCPGSRRAGSGRSPICEAAGRRERSGIATACSGASRTSSMTSTPRRSTSSPKAGRPHPSSPSRAAPTAASLSVPP